MNKKVINNMKSHNKYIGPFACLDKDAIRLIKEDDNDIRTDFFRDIDRIVHSLSYTRYIDKTQVYSLNSNDNISKRIIHVQLVSKIARTIGRALQLNEDLIEAIALGHDIGHVPFGHVGEAILNEISLKNNEGFFNHNVQSVREFMALERDGLGSNLTLQTLDGILCHNGELNFIKYIPKRKNISDFLKEYEQCYTDKDAIPSLIPMTLEGCVVRISDIVAYIGRDIEDAIAVKTLDVKKIPKSVTRILGSSNRDIVNTLILDIIENSIDKDYICMSEIVYNALMELKKFNYQEIYMKANDSKTIDKYRIMFEKVFEVCLHDLEYNENKSRINKVFLNYMSIQYQNETSNKRKVIDYIAGMTDDFLIAEYELIKG